MTDKMIAPPWFAKDNSTEKIFLGEIDLNKIPYSWLDKYIYVKAKELYPDIDIEFLNDNFIFLYVVEKVECNLTNHVWLVTTKEGVKQYNGLITWIDGTKTKIYKDI